MFNHHHWTKLTRSTTIFQSETIRFYHHELVFWFQSNSHLYQNVRWSFCDWNAICSSSKMNKFKQYVVETGLQQTSIDCSSRRYQIIWCFVIERHWSLVMVCVIERTVRWTIDKFMRRTRYMKFDHKNQSTCCCWRRGVVHNFKMRDIYFVPLAPNCTP